MPTALLVTALLALLPLVFGLLVYNLLVSARARVRSSWANVDVELRRRHDLIPRLVETVRGYADHERDLFEEVTRLRTEAEQLQEGPATADQASTEARLGGALHRLVLRAEDYPDLKASKNFQDLGAELVHTEDRIAAALRFYNSNVRDLNVRCESVPSNLVALMFGFEPAEYFQIEDSSARQAPAVSLGE